MKLPDYQRLEHIRDYCMDVQDTVSRYGNSYETFSADRDYQRSVAFDILQIGELSGKLSEEFKAETSREIPWAAIRGFRNIVVHDYGNINLEILWNTACQDIPKLLNFCRNQLTAQENLI